MSVEIHPSLVDVRDEVFVPLPADQYHLIVSTGNKIGDVVEYTSVKSCPFCGREFTEDMICKCGKNNATIRL